MAPTWRDLLVWLHVVTTVAWMSQALGLFALGLYSATTGDPRGYDMAEFLDESVLLHLAEAAFFTGLMLSALTRWGYFRYWWVLVKFAITLSQVHVAIFLLSPRLTARAEGAAEPDPFLLTGTLLMVSAIAFQAWLSVAKPWKRTPGPRRGSPRPRRPPGSPRTCSRCRCWTTCWPRWSSAIRPRCSSW
ncbi:hypothetical protein [Thermocatellispora tengchongensis]|uniref:hypothetical protein n=1 Tax=Thermocatellispora tengchongensis TaxID=1073253 RepID=UPI003642DB88